MNERRLSCRILAAVSLMLAAGLVARSAGADEVLFDFGPGFDMAQVETTDAKAALAKAGDHAALTVTTGHKEDWPGAALKAPKGTWDLSKFEYVLADVRNTGTAPVKLHLRVDNTGANGNNHCVTGILDLKPGETGTLRVAFVRMPAGPAGVKLFGMRGYPVPQDDKFTFDPAKITQLLVFVAKPTADHAVELSNIRAGGAFVAPKEVAVDAAKFFPFIDAFGQYIHRDWPGKVHAASDLEDARKEEAADLRAKPGPKNWDTYGGWKDGPTLKATGFFRTEKYEGKWWLVDPEGRLFFSHGTDCVDTRVDTPIEDRTTWFRDFPGDLPEFKALLGTSHAIKGYYTDRTMRTFDFGRANAVRKYGKDWKQAEAEIAHRRLRSWGMNTIANWSDANICLLHKTPYTATIHFSSKAIKGSQGYWGQFKDPFEPEFAANLGASMAREKGGSAGDPWCLGYFVDNEMSWGDGTALATAALASPPEQAAKKAFMEDLKAKYGDIEKLNAAWGTAHASWDALGQATAPPDKKKADDDLGAFTSRIAEQYFKIVRDVVKEVAPNQLYLGCRFAWVNDQAARAGAKFCDVVSYNRYERSVAALRLPEGAEDKPLVIGEFHFGALDRGMFHTGLVHCSSQADRAAAYKAYVRGALESPVLVGTHWFKYQDEPVLGRPLDEENYQIGLVDVCDTPYPETIEAVRDVGYNLYKIRTGAK